MTVSWQAIKPYPPYKQNAPTNEFRVLLPSEWVEGTNQSRCRRPLSRGMGVPTAWLTAEGWQVAAHPAEQPEARVCVGTASVHQRHLGRLLGLHSGAPPLVDRGAPALPSALALSDRAARRLCCLGQTLGRGGVRGAEGS